MKFDLEDIVWARLESGQTILGMVVTRTPHPDGGMYEVSWESGGVELIDDFSEQELELL